MMKNATAMIMIASLVASPSSLVLAGQTASPARGATGTPVAATSPAAADQPVDGGWPRAYLTKTAAQLLVYQPQVASWPDQKHMTAYSAVSYQPKGAKAPSLGTVKIEAQTSVAVPERLVSLTQFTISEAHFSTVPKDQLRTIVDEVTNAIPQNERIIALDRVLASVDASQIKPRNVPNIKADPPPVFFSTKPSVLVNLDGSPHLESDCRQRSQVRRQHELGPLRTRPDESVLSSCERQLDDRRSGRRPVDARRKAAAEFQQTAGGRELEGREGSRARKNTGGRAGTVRFHQHPRPPR